jgi:trk system potassium uptake protein TrkH
MTIGTASVSTGGGIKLSTFYILLKSASATIKNKHQVTINNRAISYSLVNKSYLVLLFTVSLILIGCLVLSLSDPEMSFMQIFFEITSACGTVGLSMGITPSLSVIGKLTITILMYIGRITVLTLVLSVAKKAFTHYTVAKTSMNI